MTLPFKIDLKGKTAVVTGGGGVLCSEFSKAIAACGANVAVCDLRLEAAEKVADAIRKDGGSAIAVEANVLDKKSLEAARDVILEKFGGIDILLNGAGGNNPKGTTSKEYFDPEDLSKEAKDIKTFFDLDPDGVSFVLISTPRNAAADSGFRPRDAQAGKAGHPQRKLDERFPPADEDSAYSGA